jgi:hypothetical protein
MFVTLNIVSATASHHSTTGRPFRHCANHRLGHDVEQDLVPGLRLRGDLAGLAHRQVHTDAGSHDVDRRQSDSERDRRHDLEVDDRAEAHPTDHLHVPCPGDPGDQRGENQWSDDHLDHPQEELAERTEVLRPFRMARADDPSRHDSYRKPDENLLGKGDAAAGRRGSGCRHSARILP